MKTKKSQDRKTKVEQVVKAANKLNSNSWATDAAWKRLCKELEAMVEPEARMPRFTPLLNAIWRAATNET